MCEEFFFTVSCNDEDLSKSKKEFSPEEIKELPGVKDVVDHEKINSTEQIFRVRMEDIEVQVVRNKKIESLPFKSRRVTANERLIYIRSKTKEFNLKLGEAIRDVQIADDTTAIPADELLRK